MASLPVFHDRVFMTTTTTGTGTLTLGSVVAGYQDWSVVGNGKSAYYFIEAVDANGVPTGDWETGLGTYTSSGTTLSRDVIFESSNSNNAVNLAAGTKRVALTATAVYVQQSTHSVPQLRLTTQTGVPVSTDDRTAQATIFATPSAPNGSHLDTAYLWTYTGSRVRQQSFSGDKSLGLAIVSGAVQDIFIKDSDLSLTAELWRNATVTLTIASPGVVNWTGHGLSNGDGFVFATTGALPTGIIAGKPYFVRVLDANSFNIASTPESSVGLGFTGSQSGVQTAYCINVYSTNTTNPRTNALVTPSGTDLICSGADNTFLWLGTVQASGTNITEDSAANRLVWNASNQVPRALFVRDVTNLTWTYSTDGYEQADNLATNQVGVVNGWHTFMDLTLIAVVRVTGTATAVVGSSAIGEDSVKQPAIGSLVGQFYSDLATSDEGGTNTAKLAKPLSFGAHFYAWLESGNGNGTVAWLGSRLSPTIDFVSGLSGWVMS